MSEPTSPDDRAVGAPERLHPLFLLTGLGGPLRGFAGGYAAVAYLAVSGRLTTAIVLGVLLLILVAGGIALYWSRFEYRVGQSEVRIDSGVLSRTHRSIPFDRIQDVDITQGPLARLFGLAQVKFETGGSAGTREDEGVIQAITLQRAQEIRALVRSRRSTGPTLEAAAGEERPPIYAMSFARLLLAGTFNFSLAVFAGLFGLVNSPVGEALNFDPFSRGFWEGVLSARSPIADYVLQHRLAAAAAGSLFLVLLGLLTGITRTLLRDYRFRLDRTEIGLRRRRGLLTRTDVTLPVARAQAVILRTGPLRDAFAWSELMLQSLARDEGGRGDHVLAPLANGEEAGAIVGELGWRPLPSAISWIRVSSAYFWTLAIAVSPLFLVALAQAAFSPALGAAYATALLLVLAFRWLAWRRTAYALDGDRLLMRSGWWLRRLVVLPFARIQSLDLAENFVGRWFGIASLRFGVAGGSGVSGHIIPAIPSAGARQLREDLLGSAL
jgi:putative membrane protein